MEQCPTCGRPGSVEVAVLDDIQAMGDLVGREPSLAASAVAMARALDTAEERNLAALAKELRCTLAELMAGRRGEDGDDDGLSDLDAAE